MHVLRNTIIFFAENTAAITALKPAMAQELTSDKFFGYFNPPEYILINVASDRSGHIYAIDVYQKRIRKIDPQGYQVEKWLSSSRGIGINGNNDINTLREKHGFI